MGKALVFDGIVISEPLGEPVHFTDGLAQPVRTYINKLSTNVTDAQKQAFQTFYETLNNAGLWDKITCLYPMWGNRADCAFGLIGDNLDIPTGATYDKGINLVNASGGFGAAGKGIQIPFEGRQNEKFPSNSVTSFAWFANLPYDITNTDLGCILLRASDTHRTEQNSPGYALKIEKNYGVMQMKGSAGCNNQTMAMYYNIPSSNSKGFWGEGHRFKTNKDASTGDIHKMYHNGIVVSSSENINSTNPEIGTFGINAAAQDAFTYQLTLPVNMVIVFEGTDYGDIPLTETQVETLTTAVNNLTSVIFA